MCADQYHLTISRAQVSTHRGQVFLKLSADKLLVLKWSQAQVHFQVHWVHAESFVSSSCDVFNCLFHGMYKMKYSCYQDSSVIHGWFVYWDLVEKCAACQSHRKSDFTWRRFRLSPCLMRKRFEKSQAMMAFRTWISTGKPEQLWYLMFVCFFFRLAFENENCCLCKCFTELYFCYWLLEVSLAILIKVPVVFSLT